MKAILAIARTTIPELARQKLLIVPIIGVVLSLLALAGTLLLTDGSLDLERAEAESVAWAAGAAAVIGATVYALLVGATLIAREIADGTLLMLAVRPIARWKIIVGRVLGATIFIVVALLAVCLVYGLVAMIVSGMRAPFEEAFEAAFLGLPAVLLAVCVGTAFSVQGKSTAAIGSAIGVSIFALFLAGYVQDWRAEEHRRSFLVESVRDKLPSNDGIVGPTASLMVRIMPFGVFGSQGLESYEEEIERTYVAIEDGGAYPDEDDKIDVMDPRIRMYLSPGVSYGPESDPMAAVATAPPTTGTAPGVTIPPGEAIDPTIDPATGMPMPKLPKNPTKEAFECAEYNGTRCFFGYRGAWKQRRIDRAQELHDGRSLLFAWLAIPMWIGIATLLLTRRRDLTG